MIASDDVIQTTANRIMAHSVHDIMYKLATQEVGLHVLPNNTCNAISFGSWNREILYR